MIKTTYTWKNKYILPYESYFSIRAKFCFLNGKSWYWFDIHGRKLLNVSKNIHLESNLKNIRFEQLRFEDDIKICPVCIKYGYHSYFHNSVLVDKCFIHPTIKLVTLKQEDIKHSNSGIYKFADVSTENIINATNLLNTSISRFTKHQNNIELIHMICRDYNIVHPYNSSMTLIQKYYFGNNVEESNNYNILKEIPSKSIYSLNKVIYNKIISSISKDVLKRDILLYNDNVEKNIRDRIQLRDEKYIFKTDGDLSIYFLQAFISDKIWNIFKTTQEYNRIYSIVYDSQLSINSMSNDDVFKVAVYLAISSLINYSQCDGYYRLNGKLRDYGEMCKGATSLIRLLLELNNWKLFSDVYLENSFIFICEIIINDWFNYIVNDLIIKINNKKNDYNKANLLQIPISEYNEPEYFIIKYNDKFVILASYPDSK